MAELEGFEIGDPVAELYERNLTSSSAESKHVTAVLEAVADILRQEGIKPSPTAVFAASLSSLERANTEASPEMSAAMLTVLGVALEHAPTGPVLSRLPHAMQVLLATGRAAGRWDGPQRAERHVCRAEAAALSRSIAWVRLAWVCGVSRARCRLL